MSENSEHVEVPLISSTTTNSESGVNHEPHKKKKEIMKKREELIRLSEDGEISQLVQNLKKASDKVILKIHAEYEVKQAEKANAF